MTPSLSLQNPWRALALYVPIVVLVVACSAPAAGPPPLGSAAPPEKNGSTQAQPKRVKVAIAGIPTTLSYTLGSGGAGGIRGLDAVEQMLNGGLTVADETGALRPRLAEAVPSFDNQLWQVDPDGRMTTTWTIRSGAHWHDGTPLTSDDLSFTLQVEQDVPQFSNSQFSFIDSVETPDPRTVTVRWKSTFIQADALFSYGFALPLPKHVLERTYEGDKANFVNAPYWTSQFVGTGPYRLQDWVAGASLTLNADDAYPLGRPKIDEVEVKFIPDTDAMMASILAGDTEINLGRSLSIDQAVAARNQWRDGSMLVSLNGGWLAAYPQMLTPSPAIIANAAFRQALLSAIDRQQMVEAIEAGQSQVADSYVNPQDAAFQEVASSIVRYPYDPQRAAQMIAGLGYAKGADGYFVDAANQLLSLEVRTQGNNDLQEKTMSSTADFWQRAGVEVDQMIEPVQRVADREYRANFPGFEVAQQPDNLNTDALTRFLSSQAPLPENNYVGNNRMRYRNSDLDAVINRFYTTIQQPARVQALAQAVAIMTEQVLPIGLFYNATPTLVANRLRNVTSGGSASTPAWNAADWDIV